MQHNLFKILSEITKNETNLGLFVKIEIGISNLNGGHEIMSHIHYKQLCEKERCFIEISLKNKHSIRGIAKELNRNPSTISREIRRNQKPNKNKTCRVNKTPLCKLDGRNYRGTEFSNQIVQAKADYKLRCWYFEKRKAKYIATNAERKARDRKRVAGAKANPLRLSLPEHSATKQFIMENLTKRWSPEQISFRIKYLNDKANENGDAETYTYISPVSIYRFLYSLKDKSLISCLRRRGRVYRYSNPKTIYNQTNRAKHSIHDRPLIVDELSRIGDLEGDTIVGKDKRDRLLTHTDRRTGLTSIGLVNSYNAYKITMQTNIDIKRVFGAAETITYDNGAEFTFWKDTERLTGANIYFADPYTPRQRGRNENANGLIRDFLPKGTDFKKLTSNDIMKIEFLLNNRPRKRLGGMTPLEAYVALSP